MAGMGVFRAFRTAGWMISSRVVRGCVVIWAARAWRRIIFVGTLLRCAEPSKSDPLAHEVVLLLNGMVQKKESVQSSLVAGINFLQ